MTSAMKPSQILAAVDCLKAGERQAAAELLSEELRDGPVSGDRYKSLARLAGQIGEIDIAIEAARRYANSQPPSIERSLAYWSELTTYGRSQQALSEIENLPAAQRKNPTILHMLGTLAGQHGDFARAEKCFREALAQTPYLPQTWFALAMIKTFTRDDPDFAAMERYRSAMTKAEPSVHARFLFGLAKAWHDCGDTGRAFELYASGAKLRSHEGRYDPQAFSAFCDSLISGFTPEAMARLTPSSDTQNRAIFVNGLPRSGTTLVEQILTSHSQVADGSEINLLRAALIPTGDYSFGGALSYQKRSSGSEDPWGDLATQYYKMLEMRFQTDRLVVDKTLSQSHFMGLLLHTCPNAKVIWMRRDPADTALSCFRNFFTAPIPWTWSLEHIGHHFRQEDRLYEHWSTMFPDRILTVPYESLAAEPQKWIPRILDHAGLAQEPQVFEFHKTKRSVRTASVQQVRSPISTGRIGLSKGYDAYLGAFREAYQA